MAEPTIEEQLAIITNSRNAILNSNNELIASQAKAVSDLVTMTTDRNTIKTERDGLLTHVETLTAEKTALTSDNATLNSQLSEANAMITALQASIIELTPPPKPVSITKYQVTRWLRNSNLLTIEQDVTDLIALLVPDPGSQRDALDRWTQGSLVLRNDGLIEALGQQLGMTTQLLDEAFEIASKIQ